MRKIRKNDTVELIAGRDKGKKGKVLKVFPGKNRVIVEGANFVKKHLRASQKNPKGGIVQLESPLNATNVRVVCSRCQRGIRVGSRVFEDGTKVRFCRRCGESIER